jgi:hypothetical protein
MVTISPASGKKCQVEFTTQHWEGYIQVKWDKKKRKKNATRYKKL